MDIKEIKKLVKPLDAGAMIRCKERWNSIAKPIHSLGRLEDAVMQLAGIMRTDDVNIDKRALVVMCSDNGVVEEGVTQTGSEVTAIVAENFLSGDTSACIMAEYAGADIFPVDIGIKRDTKLLNKKISYGTKNMAKEPAMTEEEAWQAVITGIETVKELKEKDYRIIAAGEMGIGNTTTSSAVAAVLLKKPVSEVTGRGAGLDEERLARKIAVIEQSIALHKPKEDDIIDVIAKVGGYDIAGMTGIFLGGAIYGIPVIIDGFIAGTAALCASRISSLVRSYAIPSHLSGEPAANMILEALNMEPFLTCRMSLGEGTGALALLPLLDMSLNVYKRMSTFEEIEIAPYEPMGCFK